MKEAALAVFVKTPGLSPIKTRLAQSLGKEFAEFFFKVSTEYLKTYVLSNLSDFDVFWAIAEQTGNEYWKGFDCLTQGEGELGERLATIDEKLKEYRYVFLMGADSPMVGSEEIYDAYTQLKNGNNFVLGPAFDGGFYLYASQSKIPQSLWKKIPYSTDQTRVVLENALTSLGKVAKIKQLLDIDTNQDLKAWIKTGEKHPVIEQIKSMHNIIYTTLSE